MLEDNNFYIYNASIVNEHKVFKGNVLVQDGIISRVIGAHTHPDNIEINPVTKFINAEGLFLLPGGIDEHVHFRDPGLTCKGDFFSESRAAVAGGICSVIDMPNTIPQTTGIDAWQKKQSSARGRMFTNYAFYLGATNHNMEEIKRADRNKVAGVKMFFGSSTGDMLLSDENTINKLFQWKGLPFLAHCEEDSIIKNNFSEAMEKYGDSCDFGLHPIIRSEEACYQCSLKVIQTAKKFHTPIHILHVSTAKELKLISEKHPEISLEICPSYLFFCDKDYKKYKYRIKCNPSIKTEEDREALIDGIDKGLFTCAGSDHAPHTIEEKDKSYFQSPSGIPMVQHTFQILLELCHEKKIKITSVVELMSHGPARLLNIKNKGFIKEGYDADLVLIDMGRQSSVHKDNLYYKCKWSPLEGFTFNSVIHTTFVNGKITYNLGRFASKAEGKPLIFNR